jgi:rod shape-determining protein MreC
VIGRPAAHAARVQLIIDGRAAAGAITERTRAGGMVVAVRKGAGLKLDLVPQHQDVKAGDVVMTSGIDGIYPKGYAIGTVERVDGGQHTGLYLDIDVRPAVDFGSLEEVLVVLIPPRPATAVEQEATGPGGAGAGK